MTLRILVVCTANRCRSPMATALLARRLPAATVVSAGSLEGGHPASGGSVRAMARRGLDIAGHRSRELTPEIIEAADLVLGLARSHVREVAVLVPAAFPRTFTMRELARRGSAVPPAATLGEWLEQVGAGRRASELMGEDPDDDVADPIGQPDDEYERTAAELEELVARLGRLLDPYLA